MEVTEAMVEKGAMVAVVVAVMVVVTVVMEAEIGATAVGKGAMVAVVAVATPTGVVATRGVEEEDTETTGWSFNFQLCVKAACSALSSIDGHGF